MAPVLPVATASGFTMPRVNVDGTMSPEVSSSQPGLEKRNDVHGPTHDTDAGGLEGGELLLRGSGRSGDDGSGVSHSPSLGCGLSGDEPHDRLLHVLLYESRGILLVGSTDFSDHYDGIGSAVPLECLQAVDEVRADDGISANADARAL